jgi:uncharacterized protein (UPF0261 family)
VQGDHGLVPARRLDQLRGQEILGLHAQRTSRRLGVGYVPQGRRLWRSLTVDEHAAHGGERKGGAWRIDRVYATFPRLAERRGNGGAQLSGGEQQMLAIGRALLLNPAARDGRADRGPRACHRRAGRGDADRDLAEEGDIDVLLIEQNIGVACAVAETASRSWSTAASIASAPAAELAADRDLQQRLLGVGRHGHEDTPVPVVPAAGATPAAETRAAGGPVKIYMSNPNPPTRWSKPVPVEVLERTARIVTAQPLGGASTVQAELRPLSTPGTEVVLVAGTLDTKGDELRYMRDIVREAGLAVRLVDLSTTGGHSGADVPAHLVAAFHPRGASGVFTGDRGASVAGMTEAFVRWIQRQSGIAGILSAGGSGGTAIVAPAMRALPVGVPKLIVSTVASGDVRQYVGTADIAMMHSVADVQGLNVITEDVLANAAHAMIGMVQARRAARPRRAQRPAVALSMFGVTTRAVQQIAGALRDDFDCLVFHATGIGGQSMERLIDDRKVMGVLDVTTTEIADMLFGGVLPATPDRFGAVIRTRLPYIGSVGAVDMVNFGPPDTVPERYRGRLFYRHNPQVTLMRTTAEECAEIGRWIARRLNEMDGPVRFFLPEAGVSALDAPGRRSTTRWPGRACSAPSRRRCSRAPTGS